MDFTKENITTSIGQEKSNEIQKNHARNGPFVRAHPRPTGNYKVGPIPAFSGNSEAAKIFFGKYECIKENGTGSFGVVYKAKDIKTGQIVAIKRVLQDKRYKNRELQIMKIVSHPNIVRLIDSYIENRNDDVYLNLVLEYMPLNLYQYCRIFPPSIIFIKLYMYQLLRSLSYLHRQGICHRDIKPQNLLVNSATHNLKLCDFGSAKILTKGEPNMSYICSRYYRAPELIFQTKNYTTSIDIWSAGCVMAELILGKPLFAGETQAKQLIEIVRILGTPTVEDLIAMNPEYKSVNMAQVLPHPWKQIFPRGTPVEAIEILTKMLVYNPSKRIDSLKACAHPFFDELRRPNILLPNKKPLPPIDNFTDDEIVYAKKLGILDILKSSHDRNIKSEFENDNSESTIASLPTTGDELTSNTKVTKNTDNSASATTNTVNAADSNSLKILINSISPLSSSSPPSSTNDQKK